MLALPLAWELQGLMATLPPWVAAPLVGLASGARPPSHRVLHRWTWVPTEGGLRLATELFLPEGAAQAPTVLMRLPLTQHPWHQAYAQLLGQLWAARGYAVVAQRTRGKGGSEGLHQAMGLEGVDGEATWRWLQGQTWWDGRFGTFGGSAFGYNQWALSPKPGLQAQLIQVASANPEALLRPGGAFALASALHWARSDGPLLGAWPTPSELAPGLIPGLATLARPAACQAPDRDFKAWALAPQGAALWRRLDLRPARDQAKAPVLLMAGWHDPYLPSQLEDWLALRRHPLERVREGSRLVVGPWAHARGLAWPGRTEVPDYRLSSLAAALPWFDAWMPPQGGLAAKPGPRVQAFRRGAERWEALPDWPPPASWRPKEATRPSQPWEGWAQPGPGPLAGQLGETAPSEPRAIWRLRHDPHRPVTVRGGFCLGDAAGLEPQGPWPGDGQVWRWRSPPLARRLWGEAPELCVRIGSQDATEGELFARLNWRHAGGPSHPLAEGIRRLRLSPQGQELRMKLSPLWVELPEGSQLELILSASAHPLFAVHPNPSGGPPEAMPPGPPCTLELAPGGAAMLKLRSWVLTE